MAEARFVCNSIVFNGLVYTGDCGWRWQAACTSRKQLEKIGFPGWPEHNLDCVPVLGGQLTKGACTGPLFILSQRFLTQYSGAPRKTFPFRLRSTCFFHRAQLRNRGAVNRNA